MIANQDVIFLNPRTCGIYKNGGIRYKTDSETGRRTDEIDNELIEAVEAYLIGEKKHGEVHIPLQDVFQKRVIVPTYYDDRHNAGIKELLQSEQIEGMSIGELIDNSTILLRAGHGSPGNDQRTGTIPYIKVSDIRGLRINVNPTNLVSQSVAERFWRGKDSGINAWDVLTPNRASSNIGEFAVILPGEEQVVLTKEVFIFRIIDDSLLDAFYLLWAFSLRCVRDQWRRIALMQTNREDCGDRYREIILPRPKDQGWATGKSDAFRTYFQTLADAKTNFISSLKQDTHEYVANAYSALETTVEQDNPGCEEA